MPGHRPLVCLIALILVAVNACGTTVSGRPVAGPAPTTTTTSETATTVMDCEYVVLADEGQPMRRNRPPSPDGFRTGGKLTIWIDTNLGRVDLELDPHSAPCSVHSFRHLVRQQAYSASACHRLTVEAIFVLQCGDPTGTGVGTTGYEFDDPEAVTGGYTRGVVAMANAGPGTNSAQFFIVHQDSPSIEPLFPVIGRITRGMEIIDQVAAGGVAPGSELGPADGKPVTPLVMLVVEPA